MPEVRQEVIVLTAVVVTALLTFIGVQALYPPTAAKKPFVAKRITTASTGSKESTPKDDKTKTAPKVSNDDESMRGKLLENSSIDAIYLHEIRSLRTAFTSSGVANVPKGSSGKNSYYNKIMGEEDFIINEIKRKHRGHGSSDAFLRAGPRADLHFDPTKVRAAVVTCGGLCPGLNSVIRELVHSLHYLYEADMVFGIRGGFSGFHSKPGLEPIELTLEVVADIHHQGGSILGSARGGFDVDVIINFLEANGINQLYVIGGDGTHRGANILAETCFERHKNIAVVGIPKTIDNDVDLIDRSFGFTTSVERAQEAIISAKTEARCAIPNGIGIVKLMGRSAGFIAVHATLASGDVDLCLVPEVGIELEGENGCLPFLFDRVKQQGHAVVVVAEGAGEDLLGKSVEVDKGGNRKLPAIGEYLKTKIAEHFAAKGEEATIKYLDPSYMIRSVPANASDSLYCMVLAQNAVHGAMAGYTSFSVGLINNRVVLIPIPRLVATSPRVMDPTGRTWERVLSITRQPNAEASFDPDTCTAYSRTML